MSVDVYKSLLFELSQLPEEHLMAVSSFIEKLKTPVFDKKENRKANLAILNEDTNWDENDFKEYREATKSIGEDVLKPKVEW